MKHNSGSYAVITEQGSSASQMTAAIVEDVMQDHLIVHDKLPTKHQLIPKSKWRTLHDY